MYSLIGQVIQGSNLYLLTVSEMGVWVSDVSLFVDHRVDARARTIRREVSSRMLHVVRAIARYNLPLEDTICHRAEHRRSRIICA